MAFTPISPFSQQLDRGLAQIERRMGVTITYRRDALEVTGTAVIGRSTFDAIEDEQAVTEMDMVDLIVPRTFPDFGIGWTEPEQGDRIEFADPTGQTRLLEVLRPNAAEPPWRFTDSHQTRIRIHTKFVEESA